MNTNITNTLPFIAGNWKMYKTLPEALSLIEELKESAQEMVEAQVVVIPPFPVLKHAAEALEGSPIQLGGQNLHWEESGAFTGEVSAPMLKSVGCDYVVIGHSERRQYFGETDETVNKKVKAALSHGLRPIMCLGESLEERENEETMTKVGTQLRGSLRDLTDEEFSRTIIAYEPIWAIGTGLTATPEQAQEVHAFIRGTLSERYGNNAASCAIILYGGSVKPANAFDLLSQKDINGALVGGAALKADFFTEIIKEALRAYKEK